MKTNPANELDRIPPIFFDSNFSLENKETFNRIISFKLFEKTATMAAQTKPLSGDYAIPEVQTCKDALDKLSYYLDITETHISKQISTKANSFFFAMTSQDEVQEHILRTCKAVKTLRKNIAEIDEKVFLISIRALKLVSLKIKYKNLVEKVNQHHIFHYS